ncbi:unnamed protein product, partial [Trichobilharzia regenti]
EPFIIFSGGGRSPGAQTVGNIAQSSVTTTNVASASSVNSDPSEIDPTFSSPYTSSSYHTLTIKRGKRLVVLQLDHKLIQFTPLCLSPYPSETMDPYAVAILLQEDLVIIDLLSNNNREWPITGGEWGLSYQPFPELIITGHADGSVRFWDASEGIFLFL